MRDRSDEGTYIDVCCFCLDNGDLSGLVAGDETGGCERDERNKVSLKEGTYAVGWIVRRGCRLRRKGGEG